MRGSFRSDRSASFWMGAGLWFLAFSHRLFLLLGNRDRTWPFPIFYEGDSETFFHYALAILNGQVYDGGIPFHPPAFAYLLAGLHGILGAPGPNMAVRILLAALCSLQIPLLWSILRRTIGPGAALAGSLLAVYSFGLMVLSIAAVSEGLYLTLLLWAVLLFLDLAYPELRAGKAGTGGSRRPGMIRAALLGLALGLLALTRAEGLGVAAVLLVWGVLRRAPRPAPLSRWAVALGILVLSLVPWTARNASTLAAINDATPAGIEPLPELVVTTAYGPLNFALANHPEAPGYFTRRALSSGLTRAVLDLRNPQHRELFLHGYARGLRFLQEEPGEFAGLVGRKLALLGRVFHLGWTQWNLPGGLKGTRYPVDMFSPDAAWAVPVHLALLIPGVVLLARRREDGARPLLLLAFLLCLLTAALAAAFFGYVRQGALLLPWIHGIQGAALAWAAARIGRGIPASLGKPLTALEQDGPAGIVVVLVLILWLAGLGGAFQNRNYMATGETMAGSQMLNRDSVMYLEWIRGETD